MSTVPLLVERSDAIATVPRWLGDHYARSHAIRQLPFPYKVRPLTGYMIWHKAFDTDRGHEWLRESIIERAARNWSARPDTDPAPTF